MRKLIKIAALFLLLCPFFYVNGSAAQFLLSASVSQATDVDVTLTKIDSMGTSDPGDDVWATTPSTSLSFGNLVLKSFTDPDDPSKKYMMFLPSDNSYYAADVGVNGAGPWTINHIVTGADLLNSGDDSLGDNIVVTFVKQTSPTTAVDLDKVTIMNANKSYNSAALSDGWLRIYYGIATGDTGEPADAKPISPTQNGKSYSGTVQITLTPN